MCPSCFRLWQLEASARSLRAWLASFGKPPPANDVLRPAAQQPRPSVARHSARR